MKRPSPAVINILLVAVLVLAVLLGIFLVSSEVAMTAASSALAFLFGEEAANAVGMVSRLIVVGTFVVGAVLALRRWVQGSDGESSRQEHNSDAPSNAGDESTLKKIQEDAQEVAHRLNQVVYEGHLRYLYRLHFLLGCEK